MNRISRRPGQAAHDACKYQPPSTLQLQKQSTGHRTRLNPEAESQPPYHAQAENKGISTTSQSKETEEQDGWGRVVPQHYQRKYNRSSSSLLKLWIPRKKKDSKFVQIIVS